MALLAFTSAFSLLWPIFGTANQLLASLSLLSVSGWLLLRRRKIAFTLVPAVFMIVTTLASLGILLGSYIRKKNYILMTADILLFILAIGVAVLVVKRFTRKEHSVFGPTR
jgi:carbon starvation protein